MKEGDHGTGALSCSAVEWGAAADDSRDRTVGCLTADRVPSAYDHNHDGDLVPRERKKNLRTGVCPGRHDV